MTTELKIYIKSDKEEEKEERKKQKLHIKDELETLRTALMILADQ